MTKFASFARDAVRIGEGELDLCSFPDKPPARYCTRADLVKPEFLVEIASVAHLA
jgi:hypothetical protein